MVLPRYLTVVFTLSFPYVQNPVLESNPILEAFGNARTIRNDNSSRFGKFIELQFQQSGALIGASVDTYLLEKVRLIHQNAGERNFHIFYEMLAAVTEAERNVYFLENYTAQDFKMISNSGCFVRRDGADDGVLFDELVLCKYLPCFIAPRMLLAQN